MGIQLTGKYYYDGTEKDMRNTAYKLTAFTAIISAAGFLLRWLQNIRIFDAETGLAETGRPISFLVAGIIVLAAAAFGVIALRLKRYEAPAEPDRALGGQTFIHTAVCALAVLLLAASGGMQLLAANTENFAENQLMIRRILAVATLAAALLYALLMTGLSKPERAGLRRWCSGLLILFGGLWLSAEYKSAASDPVLWRSAVEILAVCASLMAFYHVAGYFFGQPNASASVFFCDIGAFLCIMSSIDDHTGAEDLCFASVALVLLIWSYSIIANLGPVRAPEAPQPEAPEKPEAIEE